MEPPVVTTVNVGDDYFEALDLQLLRGRVFTAADGLPGQQSAIVNRRFVAIHFPDEDPIGRRIKLNVQNSAPNTPEPAWLTIAGVAPDIRQSGLQDPETDPVVYGPHRTESPRSGVLILRTAGDPASVTALVRDTLRVLEPDLPLFNIQTLDQRLAEQRWQFQIFGTMFGTFALMALVLSAVGLYAVTAYSVTRRTQEIGLRVALGARPWQVQWLILRLALGQLAIGVTIGVCRRIRRRPVAAEPARADEPHGPHDTVLNCGATTERGRGGVPLAGTASGAAQSDGGAAPRLSAITGSAVRLEPE